MFSFLVALVAAAASLGVDAALRTLRNSSMQLARTAAFEQAQMDVDVAEGVYHPSKLAFIVHRKTGFILTKYVSRCLDLTNNRVHHIMDPTITELEDIMAQKHLVKFVHLARDPINLAVSNYLYNKYASHEPGTLGPGTAKGALFRSRNHCEQVAFEQLPPIADNDETHRDYLQRINNSSGLLGTLCETRPIIDRMLGHKQWCEENSHRCMQVTLDGIMVSSEAFMDTFKKIVDYAGLDWTPRVEKCLSYQDINSPNFGASATSFPGHCSVKLFNAETRDQLKAEARQFDLDLLGGYYQSARVNLPMVVW